jgi:hypothetical protein
VATPVNPDLHNTHNTLDISTHLKTKFEHIYTTTCKTS